MVTPRTVIERFHFWLNKKYPVPISSNTWFIQEQQPFPHDIALGKRLLPNTVQQIRYMADLGIEIGAHTRTHADMGKIHDLHEIRRKSRGCGDELEQMLGQRVPYFAFPYGLPRNMTSMAFRVAREHGYEGVCSAYVTTTIPVMMVFIFAEFILTT